MKKIIMSIVLAIALVVPVVELGVTEQTEIVQAKSNLGKYVTKKNYKKIKKGMSFKKVCKIFKQKGIKDEVKYVDDDEYIRYFWCNYKKRIYIEIWFENGKSDVKYYSTY